MRIWFLFLATWILLSFIFSNSFAVDSVITTAKEQTNLEVTIYNSNIGLVKDQRKINFLKGLQELRYMDVASKIIPESVSIRCLTNSKCMNVFEQNYEYDLISPEKLLEKYIGKEVKLYTKNPYTEKEEIVKARVLSNHGYKTVFQIGDEITFGHSGRIIFPEMPKNFISKPTLLWLLQTPKEGQQDIEGAYLTEGINWYSNYVLTLNDKDDMANLTAWVTIINKSGATYMDANLKLVAGDIQRIQRKKDMYDSRYVMLKSAEAPTMQMTEKEFFEYYIYNLNRKTTLKDNQTKQIVMVEASQIPLKKEYVYKETNPFYYTSRYFDTLSNTKVDVFIEFMNSKEHNLGIALPKGDVRVYKYDHDKSLQFIGENSIDHTPKNEKIRFKIGSAFDIKVTRKQTEWTKLTNNIYESSYLINLRNHKKEDIVVTVIEKIPGSWKVLNSSLGYKKYDSGTIHFTVPIKKESEANLTYTVRVEY